MLKKLIGSLAAATALAAGPVPVLAQDLKELNFGIMTKAFEPRPVFVAYLARMAERPAQIRANKQAEDLTARLKALS